MTEIKYRRRLNEYKELVQSINYRLVLLEQAYDRTETLEFHQWFKHKSNRLPVGNLRLSIRLKMHYLETERDALQCKIDEYESKKKQKIITDCYIIKDKDKGRADVFICVNNAIKERKLFTYPLESMNILSSNLIDKPLKEIEDMYHELINK